MNTYPSRYFPPMHFLHSRPATLRLHVRLPRLGRYGGHVTDAFDRRLVTAYLENYLHPELLDGFQVRKSGSRVRNEMQPLRFPDGAGRG